MRDPLTGLHNRRFVGTELPLLLQRAADTCPHEAGDLVLQQVAGLLTARAQMLGAAFGSSAPTADPYVRSSSCPC
jgi:GGDEF domain-containing protein